MPVFKFKVFYLLCCPALDPQITGDPLPLEEVTLNLSPVQSPIAPPTVVVTSVATDGPPTVKV